MGGICLSLFLRTQSFDYGPRHALQFRRVNGLILFYSTVYPCDASNQMLTID